MRRRWSQLLLALGIWLQVFVAVTADDSCNVSGNLTVNCNFDSFTGRDDGKLVPEGWTPWVLMGEPAFDIDDHGSAPGAPALRIWSDGGVWTAGIYQRVPVTPGRGYRAKIDWAAPTVENIERKVGIDPTGGIDPASSHVVWSASSWVIERMPFLEASAYAPGPTVTVFVWTHHGVSYGQDEVFIDAVTLVEDSSVNPPAPTAVPATATPTPRPPTRMPPTATPTLEAATPSPPLPATTDVQTPTLTLTATAEVPADLPTQVPTEPSTATPTATPSPMPATMTPTPTWTPTITPIPVASLGRTSPPRLAAQGDRTATRAVPAESLLLAIAGGAVLGAVLLVALVVWLWLRSRTQAGGERGGSA